MALIASAPARAQAPSDPRFATLDPEMQAAILGEIKGNLDPSCQDANFTAPVYDCTCYADKAISAQLDRGPKLVALQSASGNPRKIVEPQLAIVMPAINWHDCINPAALGPYAQKKAMAIMGNHPSDKDKAIAQCVADRVPADFKAKGGTSISAVDNLTAAAYARCSSGQ